jgi:YHS domain-containing protein
MPNSSRRRVDRAFVFLAAALLLATARLSGAAENYPLAIKGYDPVAYFTLARPTPGLPSLEYEWDEHRYRFSSEENLELFKADPARYAPQFAQFCAMALSKGEIVEANPQFWLVVDNNLYIFGKPTGPALFQQNLAENVARANRNRALIADH